jgi:hypothetical protein
MQEISARILTLVASGLDLETAFNAVLGPNAYANLASELYDQIRKGA